MEEGVFNYSGNPIVSWYDFAVTIYKYASRIDLINRKLNIEKISSFEYADPVIRPKYSVLSSAKLHNSLRILPDDWKEELLESLKKIKK